MDCVLLVVSEADTHHGVKLALGGDCKLRRAAELRAPHSRCLRLGWPGEWEYLECLLDDALTQHDAGLCPCASHVTAKECEKSHWEICERACGFSKALEDWPDDHKDSGGHEGDPRGQSGAVPAVFD